MAGIYLVNATFAFWVVAAAYTSAPPYFFMARTFSSAEWELRDIPRQLLYHQSYFGNTRPCLPQGGPECMTVDEFHRAQHEWLLTRQTTLTARLRRESILDRWVMRKYPTRAFHIPVRSPGPLTDMGMDEVIEDGKIVDKGD